MMETSPSGINVAVNNNTNATNSVTDAELFDMLFGSPASSQMGQKQANNTSNYNPMQSPSGTSGYSTQTAFSDPGCYGFIERCWEPGEILDQELELQSSSSTASSSPSRPYQHHHPYFHRKSHVKSNLGDINELF